MNARICSIAATLALAFASLPAHSAVVEYSFEGIVSTVSAPLAGGPVSANNPLVGSLFVETTPQTQSPSVNSYRVTSLSVRLGNTYSITSPVGLMRLANFGSTSTLIIDATSGQGLVAPVVNGTNVPDYFFLIFDDISPAISALPQSVDFSVAASNRSGLRFNVNDSNQYRLGITSFEVVSVPLPAAVPMLGASLAFLWVIGGRYQKTGSCPGASLP